MSEAHLAIREGSILGIGRIFCISELTGRYVACNISKCDKNKT